jgi:predicted DNA-binding transcriptional regulator AlpA
MSTDELQSELPMAATNLNAGVSISKWVNEACPPWDEILSAHDVARLTRRHRWVLSAMAALRRFPRKRKFHGRAVGWHRGDVVRWLANHHSRPTALRRPLNPSPALPSPGGLFEPPYFRSAAWQWKNGSSTTNSIGQTHGTAIVTREKAQIRTAERSNDPSVGCGEFQEC